MTEPKPSAAGGRVGPPWRPSSTHTLAIFAVEYTGDPPPFLPRRLRFDA
mgnify:CR=1 FL=1